MMFLSLDGTLVVQLLNFAIFFALLNVVFLRPVAAAIHKRRQYIDGLVSDYDRYQAEAHSCARRPRRCAPRHGNEPNSASPPLGRRRRTKPRSCQPTTPSARSAIVEEAQQAAQTELDAARSNEGEAVRKLAGFMVDRVIPEAAK